MKWIASRESLENFVLDSGYNNLVQVLDRWMRCCQEKDVLTKPVLFALMLYGEAGGEGRDGMRNVGIVALNRFYRSEDEYLEATLLRRYQFSCFHVGDNALNGAESLSTARVQEYLDIADDIISRYMEGNVPDWLQDATLYLTPDALDVMVRRWAAKQSGAWNFHVLHPLGLHGGHFFFAEK